MAFAVSPNNLLPFRGGESIDLPQCFSPACLLSLPTYDDFTKWGIDGGLE
jgi:hypothetical protein